MGRVKNLAQYLSSVCMYFKDVEYARPLEGDEPLPKADFITYRQDELNNQVIVTQYCHGCECNEEVPVAYSENEVYIGECPYDEDPFNNYSSNRIAQALIIQLRNTFGHPPEGASLYKKFERGSDGWAVFCSYNTQHPYSMAYALMLESELPALWSPAAKRFLEDK